MDDFRAPERFDTDELTVRSYYPGDGPLLCEAVLASHDHLAPWMPWALEPRTPDSDEQLARKFRAHHLLSEDFVLAIVAPDGTRFLGGCGYHLREGPLDSGNAEMGMWIRSDAAGRGLGTLALRALLTWGFTDWPWQRLSWKCRADNLASQAVAEKAGMEREGRLIGYFETPAGERADGWSYAAVRGEWQAP